MQKKASQKWSLMMNVRVEEFTTPMIFTVERNATIDSAMSIMHENQVRHLPVSDGNKIVGIISQRDVMVLYGKTWGEPLIVEDFMSTDILSVNQNDNLGDVAYQLSANKVGSALVLDDDNKVYGIFTTTDALNALVEIFLSEANEKSDIKNMN